MKTTIKSVLTFFTLLIALFCVSNARATAFTNTLTGDWNDTATWGGSGPPGEGDTAAIITGTTVTVSDTRSVGAVTLLRTTGNTTKLAVTGSLTVTNTITQSGSAGTASVDLSGGTGTLTLSFVGTPIGSTVTLTAGTAGSTVIYDGSGNQTANPVAYDNLTLSGSGAKTATGITAISGNLTLSGTATASFATAFIVGGALDVGAGTSLTFPNAANGIQVTNTTTVSGSLVSGGQSSAAKFYGDFTINAGGTFNGAGSSPTFAGNFTYNGGTLTGGSAGQTWNFSGTSKTIVGTFIIPR